VKHFDEPYIGGECCANRADFQWTEDFRKDLLGLIPFLRAFSRSLCGDRELADDLGPGSADQGHGESRDTFRAGSNLKAWLSILRNQFYSDRRRACARRHGTMPRRADACRQGRAVWRFSFPTRRGAARPAADSEKR